MRDNAIDILTLSETDLKPSRKTALTHGFRNTRIGEPSLPPVATFWTTPNRNHQASQNALRAGVGLLVDTSSFPDAPIELHAEESHGRGLIIRITLPTNSLYIAAIYSPTGATSRAARKQAAELQTWLLKHHHAIKKHNHLFLIAGDLNAAVEGKDRRSGTLTSYDKAITALPQTLIHHGFTDLYRTLHPEAPGYTFHTHTHTPTPEL